MFQPEGVFCKHYNSKLAVIEGFNLLSLSLERLLELDKSLMSLVFVQVGQTTNVIGIGEDTFIALSD